MLQLLCSRANTGKSERILELIRQGGRERGQILLVPDHASYAAEVDLCRACGDGASRFGEVLTFRRLTERVLAETGGSAEPELDAGGKLLMMQRAMGEAASALTVYRRPARKPAFYRSFVDLMEELQRYQVSAEQLLEQSGRAEGDQARKLRDIALLYTAYESLLSRDGVNRSDYMDRLIRHLEDSGYIDGKDIYLDGFALFTAQEEAALAVMLRRAHSVTVSLLGERGSTLEIFQAGNRAYERLADLAASCGVKAIDMTERTPPAPPQTALGHLERHFFGGNAAFGGDCGAVELREAETLESEAAWAAATIRTLVAKGGYRYRDFGLAVRNLADYEAVVESVFAKYQVPVYLSRRRELGDQPVMTLVLAALEAVTEGFSYEDMFRMLKTGLTGLEDRACDLLENYVLKWDIRGTMWVREEPWTANPDGYSREMTDSQARRLEEINAIRERLRLPLRQLWEGMKGERTARERTEGLYRFLEEIGLPGRLEERCAALAERGELQRADEVRQLWELLCRVMDQFVSILGDTPLGGREFVQLMKLVVSQYSVGTIPAALDQVSFSELARNDRHSVRCLFLLGANDHLLPTVGEGGGILTDEDRNLLLEGGIRLAPHGLEKLHGELRNIYAALAKPAERLWISYPRQGRGGTALRPSFVVGRVRSLLPAAVFRQEGTEKAFRLAAEESALEAAALHPSSRLAAYFRSREDTGFRMERARAASRLGRGRLSQSAVRALYGPEIRLSASRIDKIRSCHFAYFLQYGLRAKARTGAGFDAVQVGNCLHYVLEKVTREAMGLGGLSALSAAELRSLTERHMDDYIAAAVGQLQEGEARLRYLLRRLRGTVDTVVANVAEELRSSSFVPLALELSFREGGTLPAITIREAGTTLSVSGVVDRVDGWLEDNRLYIRVVDYKTGKKSFDLADIRHGLNLQMLLYLFALEREGRQLFGYDIVPAGVLYLPARDVILNMDRWADDASLKKAMDKELRRSGLLLGEPEVLQAMEHTALTEPRYLPLALDRSRSITKGVATAAELGKLSRYVDLLLHEIAREISGGTIDADPCSRGESDNACTYCEFAPACHFAEGRGTDHYNYIRPVRPEEFWRGVDEALGEEEHHG